MTSLIATYRLQLHPGFGFEHVAAVVDYLAELGVSHVYLSPYLQAVRGSTHGYDVVDHARVNEELGGDEARAHMLERLRAHGLGQVIDVVPNHMAIATPQNRLWWDLLENGPSSRYASYFDVDWRSADVRLRDKVLMPILGDHYGRVLEAGEIKLERRGPYFQLEIHGAHVLPISPASVGELLDRSLGGCQRDELAFIADAFKQLANESQSEPTHVARRDRDKAILYRLLERLLREQPEVAAAIDAMLLELNRSIDGLDELIERQSYRIADWQMARHDIDYRRFFDVNSLAALRTERADVFYDTHALPLLWIETGEVDGVRIDHPDGLRDPTAYLRRLRESAMGSWIVVEKILGTHESLPADWPVDGTTGYDFLGLVTGLLVDPRGEPALTRLYAELTSAAYVPFLERAREKKRLVLEELFSSELTRLTNILVDACEFHTRFRDYGRSVLRDALRELIACFPGYRAYVREGHPASAVDRDRIHGAVAAAEQANPAIDRRLLRLIERMLAGDIDGRFERELVARFQQLCATVTAKGVEDTAFYSDTRFLCLNEVGADPTYFGRSVEDFHEHCLRIAKDYPRTMLASSTHDTKRSEDVRARLALLSEIPERWSELVKQLRALAARHRRGELPDPETEYAIYQTLVGAWPISEERLLGYLEKAMREAKTHSSWLRPNPSYEKAVTEFTRGLLEDEAFVQALSRFIDSLAIPTRNNLLAMLALKLTAPGVPDIYQGNEAVRYDLTDPDNRRAIDFSALRVLAKRAAELRHDQVRYDPDPSLAKLFVTRRLLHLRRELPEAFQADAGYEPLLAQGEHAARVVAYSRSKRVVTVVPRHTLGVRDWGDTQLTLPAGAFRDCFSGTLVDGGRIRLSALFAHFPIAVLRAR